MYSDTTLLKISDDGSEIKKSMEEKMPVFFSLNGGKIVSGFYTGEVTKIKTEEGKFQIPHGTGNLIESNLVAAISYSGSFYKGIFHGKGKLVTPNFTYEGDFAAGQKNGKGKLSYTSTKEEYNGDWSNDKRHGNGTMWYKDLSHYSGAWQNDKRHGNGILEFSPGFELPICEYGSLRAKSLESTWINDTINGEGVLTYDEVKPERKLSRQEEQNAINPQKGNYAEEKVIPSEGSNKKIMWNGLFPTGEFRVVFTNGNQYDGKIKNGKLDGKGKLYFRVNGAEEQGYKNGVWENGMFTGKATLPIAPKGYYKGELVKDKKQGEGEIKYADGAVYAGYWENDLRAGKGKYTWPNGGYYDGEWKNNQINGAGTMVIKGYSAWTCNWKDEIPCDSGVVAYTNGAKYIGGVGGKKDGNSIRYFYQGFGRFKQSFPSEDTSMRNDSSYVGYFHEGLPHGKGRMERNYVNREDNLMQLIYDGNWEKGLKQGNGKQEIQYMMGFESYDGEWNSGLKNGKGKMIVTGEMSETTYTGTWNNDKMTGYGESYAEFSNPENNAIEKVTYKGQFAEDTKNGQGTEISNEGTYTGEWKEGSMQGVGKMIYKNGRVYEGQWSNGMPNGDGKLKLPNGTLKQGKFIDGEYSVLTDIDGNVYNTIKVGTQLWMADNLKVTRYQNGDPISTTNPIKKDIAYDKNQPNKYQWVYTGDVEGSQKFGRYYTWFAVTDARNVCPAGWRMPTIQEWWELERGLIQLGGASNFNIQLAGYRSAYGDFVDAGSKARWWSSTDYSNYGEVWNIQTKKDSSPDVNFSHNSSELFWETFNSYTGLTFWGATKTTGLSVRCVKK